MKLIVGDLIKLAKDGHFDVIGHGCNCFCTMKSGIAVPFVKEFQCNTYPSEDIKYRGDISKLGRIESMYHTATKIHVVNMYTQYLHTNLMNEIDAQGIPLSYSALEMCIMRLANLFSKKRIGLPLIGCGRAGGDWN